MNDKYICGGNADMSRSNYSDDCDDNWALIRWRGAVNAAIKRRRGQSFCVADYWVEWADRTKTGCNKENLRKRPDPGLTRHLSGCKPYDKSYEDTIKELGHTTEEVVKRTLANMGDWVSR